MSNRGTVSYGCLVWGVIILFAIVVAWKLIDFYFLGPAAVKKVMNEVYAEVPETLSSNLRQTEYLRHWANRRDSQDGIPEMRRPNTARFSGDTFIVEYSDSIRIPAFPSYRHAFRLSKLVR